MPPWHTWNLVATTMNFFVVYILFYQVLNLFCLLLFVHFLEIYPRKMSLLSCHTKTLKAAVDDLWSSSATNPLSSQSIFQSILRNCYLFVWVCMCQTRWFCLKLCSSGQKVHDGCSVDGWRPWGSEDSRGFLWFTKPSQHPACCPLSL